jgi:hypothetical protein
VVRYGTTRAQVRGLEVVLADSRIASRLAPPPQDNAGLDLTDLLVGSEGTLAIITAARMRLVMPDEGGNVVLVGCRDLDEASAPSLDFPAAITSGPGPMLGFGGAIVDGVDLPVRPTLLSGATRYRVQERRTSTPCPRALWNDRRTSPSRPERPEVDVTSAPLSAP